MLRALNSFQFRLYAIVLLLVLLLVLTIAAGSQSAKNMADRGETVNGAASLRASAYELAGLSRRLATATTLQQRIFLSGTMRSAIDNFDRLLAALHGRDMGLDIPAVTSPEAVELLNNVDTTWITYRDTLTMYLDGITSGADEAVWMLDSIDSQSDGVFSAADKVTVELREITEGEEQGLTRMFLAAVVAAVFFAVLSIAVVFRSVQAINRLSVTAEAFARGDFKARAPTNSVYEIARLGEVYNHMSDELGRLIEELQHKVAEAQAAQESAEQADKVKSAFLASMSHELRTPLNSVINYTRFVSKGVMGPVNERQVETLGKVVDSGKHLLNLINDVLDISKIESGSLNLFLEDDVNVTELLRASVSTAEALLADKPVALDVVVDEPLPLIRADRQRIRQMLLNLLSNACKFTEHGEIRVHASATDTMLTIAVQDTGPGIGPEDRRNVFEAFKQTETGLRQGGGTGLGMPISRSLAEAHGGRLWFDSEVGKGSTFYISLPVKAAQPVPQMA